MSEKVTMSEKPWLERHLGLVVAFVGIVSAVISANVTHFLTKSRDLEKSHFELRKAAYSQFLEGQSQYRFAPQDAKANEQIFEANLNILLTSSKDLICSMVNYWVHTDEFDDSCPDPEGMKRDVAIYQEMRRESFEALDAGDPDLDPAVLVAYLRYCKLPGADLDRLCGGRKAELESR